MDADRGAITHADLISREDFIRARVKEATSRAAAIAPSEDAAVIATVAAARAARRDALRTLKLYGRARQSRGIVQKQGA